MTARPKRHFGEVTGADLRHFGSFLPDLNEQDRDRLRSALQSLAEIDLPLGRVVEGMRLAALEVHRARGLSARSRWRGYLNRRKKLVYAFDEAAQGLLICKGRRWPAGITAETAAAVEAARTAIRKAEAPALIDDERYFQRKSPRGRPSTGGDRSPAMQRLTELGAPRATARTLLDLAVKATRAYLARL